MYESDRMVTVGFQPRIRKIVDMAHGQKHFFRSMSSSQCNGTRKYFMKDVLSNLLVSPI